MKLRFKVLSPNNSGNPDYNLCGQGTSVIAQAFVDLSIDVDGENIANVSGLSNLNSIVVPITTTENSIEITDIEFINNTVTLTINHPDNVADLIISKPVNISISVDVTGYLSYNNSFIIYGNDLGQDSVLSPITDDNVNMDIVLIPTSIPQIYDNGAQIKPLSKFVAYRQPFTNNIHLYNLTSGEGIYQYFDADDNLLLTGKNGIITNKETIEISQINTIGELDCEADLQEVKELVFSPEFNTSITRTNCPPELECTLLTADNTATINIDYSTLDTVFVDDVEVYPYDEQVLTYLLYDFQGNLIQEFESTFNINPPDYVYDSSLHSFNDFVIPEKGDFILKAIVGVAGVYECSESIPLKGCDVYEITFQDCNKYSIVNNSFDTIKFDINKLNDNKEFEVVSSDNDITTLATEQIELSENGIYQVKVIIDESLPTERIEYVILDSFCNIKNCLLKSIDETICSTPTCCDSCTNKNLYDYNARTILANTYFSLIEDFYSTGNIFTNLSPNDLDKLYRLSEIISKFDEYCVDCVKTCNQC